MNVTQITQPVRTRIIRLPEVQEMVGLSRTQVWRLERDGIFPNRVRLGARSVGWLSDEIEAWVESRRENRV